MLKKIVLWLGAFIVAVYVFFLIAPFFLSGLANSYSDKISDMVEKSCGFKVKLENIRIITTPKLTAGLKISHVDVFLPDNEKFFTADNLSGKLSLIPLLVRKIEIDTAGAENVNLNLKIKKDGKFLLEDYIPQQVSEDKSAETQSLPYGLKLSNNLPDIFINNYNISFIDALSDKSYSIFGDKFLIKDFILNKKVKISALGKVQLQDRTQFNYNIKVFNKIMPDVELNDLVFPQEETVTSSEHTNVNIIDIFNALYNNRLTADINANIKTFGSFDDMRFNGFCNVSELSLAVSEKQLPAGSVDLKFNDSKIDMYTKLYTSEKELTEVIGKFKTGKHPKIGLNFKSNAQFNSIIRIVDSIASSFGYNDLATLNASGGIDADFSLKSDMRKVESSGYLKIPSASLIYGLYNIVLKNITADIDFSNNKLNIKDSGFTVMEQPLKVKGTINQNAEADITVSADKLPLKGLLLALGQISVLKENKIDSGTLTFKTLIKGRLDKIKPKVDLSIDNINVKNIPSNTLLTLKNSSINLYTDGKLTGGSINFNDAKVINPAFQITAPKAELTLDEKDINVKSAYLLYENNRIDITGKILDYMTPDLKLDFTAKGLGTVNLNGIFNTLSQKLNLHLYTTNTISMSIPGIKNSNLKADTDITITGLSSNPYLKGSINIPAISIPDMDLALNNLSIALNGYIASGNAVLKKFKSGGIIAENLSGNFALQNNILKISDITGDTFTGKVDGNISYNLSNGNIAVKFNGSDMNAESAIQGAAGIKNALSGKLGFNADVTLHGTNDVEMIKNLKGKITFNITDGTFGNIGRFENFLFAQNIASNSILKTAVNSITSLPALKNTAEFKTIKGNMTFKDGWAYINPVETCGPSMSYYVVGKYNILNGTANVVILGRISAEIVALLGPLGDLSVEKLTSFIPKFGNLTGKLINAMTSDPRFENVSKIPQLSSGNTNYKDFKVMFNGGVDSKSSVKSFKWLSKCDTSAIDSLENQIKNAKEAIQKAKDIKIDQITDKIQEQKQKAAETKQKIQNAKEELKNLKNLKNLFN